MARGSASDRGRATIVVIDDDEQFLSLATVLLEGEDYRVITCSDSRTAFAVLEREQPDLIVLDLRMETAQSGWDILKAVRAHPVRYAIPVVVCSAAVDDIQRNEALLHAWDVAVLHKPFNITDFSQLVARSLKDVVQEKSRRDDLPAG